LDTATFVYIQAEEPPDYDHFEEPDYERFDEPDYDHHLPTRRKTNEVSLQYIHHAPSVYYS